MFFFNTIELTKLINTETTKKHHKRRERFKIHTDVKRKKVEMCPKHLRQ